VRTECPYLLDSKMRAIVFAGSVGGFSGSRRTGGPQDAQFDAPVWTVEPKRCSHEEWIRHKRRKRSLPPGAFGVQKRHPVKGVAIQNPAGNDVRRSAADAWTRCAIGTCSNMQAMGRRTLPPGKSRSN
jgi:hypothetical protein